MQLPYPLHYRTFFWWWMYWEDLCPLKFVSINHCMKKAYKKMNGSAGIWTHAPWRDWNFLQCSYPLHHGSFFLLRVHWDDLWSNPPRSQRLHWVIVEKLSPLNFSLKWGGVFRVEVLRWSISGYAFCDWGLGTDHLPVPDGGTWDLRARLGKALCTRQSISGTIASGITHLIGRTMLFQPQFLIWGKKTF